MKPVELTKGKKLLRKKFDDIDTAILWLQEHPNCLVELTIESDTFLTALDRKRLTEAHDGIITIVPEVKNKEILLTENKSIDLEKTMSELFIEYFKYKKGQEPNNRIMDLFKEVIGSQDKNEQSI